jgi:DNA repair protein RadD
VKLERRAYEERAVTELRDGLKTDKIIAVAPTGAGKTVVAAMLLKRERRWKRVVFLAHRHELISQAYDKLNDLGIRAGVLMAQDEALHGRERVDENARVQVASVQTVDRRGLPDGVDLLIVDEAHRVMADSYQRIARMCPNAEVLGLTATPCRMDGRGLGEFFSRMYVIAKPSDLQADGYLSKPATWTAPVKVLMKLASKMAGSKTSNGDYTPASLAKVAESKFLIGHVVKESMRLAPGVRKVVFACNVKHSKAITKSFVRAGVKAVHLDGETDARERQDILGGLRSGAVEVVCNVDVLSEGWDLPALGAVIVARPTKSLARWLQMVGRVQRPYKGKKPIVIDHGANLDRFSIEPGSDIEWDLREGRRRKAGEAVMRSCPACQFVCFAGLSECPECGEAFPKTEQQKRQEMDAELELVTATRMAQIRERLEALARKKGAPSGWAERVMALGIS